MKKILCLALVLIVMLTLFISPCYAEGEAENAPPVAEETAPEDANTSETPENYAQGSNGDILDQLMAIVTNGEMWAKIGATVIGILAIILTLKAKFNDILSIFGGVKDMLSGKASKEDTERIIGEKFEALDKTYHENTEALTAKYDELAEKYDKQTAILSILANYLVKSPNARASILDILSDVRTAGGNVAEFVENLEKEIDDADALIPKPDTPALDAVRDTVENEKREGEKVNIILE